MAKGINKVILVGNLGADPESRTMPSGSAVTNIRVATGESWKDKKTGDQQERTEWHNVAFFGRLAEVAAEYLRKGSQVYIEGKIRTRKWQDRDGNDVFLRDIWPANSEIAEAIEQSLTPEMFRTRYANIFEGDEQWRAVKTSSSLAYEWEEGSTYCRLPPYFEGMGREPEPVVDIRGARLLALLGDSITTDHISPAGSIMADSPAGRYLVRRQVGVQDFNSYGTRRGNHEVMMRGTFANIRIRNEMVPGIEGGITCHMPDGEEMPIFDAVMKYAEEGVPLVVIAGKEYGTGSSRDWAAKGTLLLGIRAVITESFERIHRSNLVGMGVLPLVLPEGVTRKTLNLDGSETFDIVGIAGEITPGMELPLTITRADGATETVPLKCRIDTLDEVDYYRHGGILQYVLRGLLDS